MVSYFKWLLFIVFTGLFCTACQALNSTPAIQLKLVQEKATPIKPVQPIHPSHKNAGAVMISTQGTIQLLNLEGGFFGIVTDKGQNLLPMNLSKEYQQVGAVVQVEGVLLKDVVTIQQWGIPFKIHKIEIISVGKVDNNLR